MAVLPMFPLGSVLLPGEALPLHVFEPRYRQLVIDLLADDEHDPEFGVALIERGHEVGGGDVRRDVGTVARMVQVEALDGGRYAVVAVGVRRIRVRAWLPDDPYPLADVDDWPDGHADTAQLAIEIAASLARVHQTYRLAAELGDVPAGADLRVSDDPLLASYQLGAIAPIGPDDRYRVLAADTPAQRLAVLDAALDDVEAVLRFRQF
ncbi:MAG: LON peptidase substrate-binding domain-containing protein [Ilumatobacteraceae bacterium]|nr:LON peptidase substrate-binding domain-containing protein [Ilumatobacteraceae bacterium]